MDPRFARALLARCAGGEVSPELAVMLLLLEVASAPDPVETALGELSQVEVSEVEKSGASPSGASQVGADAARDEMVVLLRRHGSRAAVVAARAARAGLSEVEKCARFFDDAAGESEEAAVALYSLGDAALLDRATDELAAALTSWGVLGQSRIALDFGCGIGRIARRLASSLGEIDGVDISPRMIAAARRRCTEVENASFHLSTGRDLAMFPTARFDLVLAIDALPYVFSAGAEVVVSTFAELTRVIRPGGDLVIGNLSYRGDPKADLADLTALARAGGFVIQKIGARLGAMWDGVGFHLVKEG